MSISVSERHDSRNAEQIFQDEEQYYRDDKQLEEHAKRMKEWGS